MLADLFQVGCTSTGVMPDETVPVSTDTSLPDAGVLPDTSTTLP
jgi:hypothetical protein